MKHTYQKDELRLFFDGDFDHLHVLEMKEESIQLIERFHPRILKLDFANVTFVDSSGIGFVLARYKQMKQQGGEVIICNLSRLNKTIFDMSGIFQIIRYEKSEGRK
ncbi:anti-sigma factor antagonist [Merdibacter massiliensis]|uniref:anti-sigma factor antagonist n=1 Tax=Merdibacter massiliensis TaxID=1871030 RepID=UPI00096A57A6|nr:anti-sigma factor antagonist [Merdibacter massiliensis]